MSDEKVPDANEKERLQKQKQRESMSDEKVPDANEKHQYYQDAMALVREFGKPDFFITFTCNPQWPEDRPDLVARVFKNKLDMLMDDLKKHEVSGKGKDPEAACMQDGKCTKGNFPKNLLVKSEAKRKSYALPKRRGNADNTSQKQKTCAFRQSMSYNPYFAAKCNAYINLE
ncbi:hypothetical protein L596_017452 [Steinernema carpocapsae]|uniref:Helitron helicase-like domain-containing protein n=1 Tax=Steinernema carpocapsae TaxID=34508 RepID=A0A4U5N2E7_STECR|nr:hypothetical protein L596_017452 [Steinernema carpocapsae]